MTRRRDHLQGWRVGVLLMFVVAGTLVLAACGAKDDPSLTNGIETGVSPGDDGNAHAVLSGTITYPTRLALPRSAIVDVSLISISDDPSPIVIAAHRFQAGGQVPIRFELPYEPSRIVSGRKYGLRARILVDGALWFVNEQPVPAFAGNRAGGVQIVVRPAVEG